MNSFDIIKTVRLTEKGTKQSESFNQYTVVADRRATKIQIRNAVQELFKVKVKSVNTLVTKGKKKLFRGRPGARSDVKKAIITLEAGSTIDVTTGAHRPLPVDLPWDIEAFELSPDGKQIAVTYGGGRLADSGLNLDAAIVNVDAEARSVSQMKPISRCANNARIHIKLSTHAH